MALEIERKWLVEPDDLPFRLEGMPHHRIVQSYVSFSPQIRIRSIDDERFVLTVKGDAAGHKSALVREESEFVLTEGAYRKLFAKREGRTLSKTRYFVDEACLLAAAPPPVHDAVGTEQPVAPQGRVFEIDVFEGDFEGLVVAEMEFASVEEAQAYPTPPWARADVSEDSRYRNVVMAQIASDSC